MTEQSDAHGAADRAVCQWRAYSGGPVIAVVLPTMDAVELRTRFRKFTGAGRYRKFVRTLNRASRSKGRLLHWQQQLWDAFLRTSSETSQYTDDIFRLFAVCDVHDRKLERPTTDRPLAEIRDTPECDEAINNLFPFAINHDLICVDCQAAREHWIGENDELCRILRCETTYEQYCDRRLADVPDREAIKPKIKQRAAEIARQMQPGDKLWEWDAGGWHRLSGSAGVAIVRNGEIVKQWCEWRS